MATTEDLTGNQTLIKDTSSYGPGEDSNVNVYEFGNLILADLLPILIYFIGMVSDMSGSASSATDISESTISETDITEDVLTVTDRSGSSSSMTDDTFTTYEDSNINVYEFGNLILADLLPTLLAIYGYVLDFQGSVVSATDIQEEAIFEEDLAGVSITQTDLSTDNSIIYDFEEYTYDDVQINYNGYALQGVMVDIAGS
jgi:hypothetical protein